MVRPLSGAFADLVVLPRSRLVADGVEWVLARMAGGYRLVGVAPRDLERRFDAFAGERVVDGDRLRVVGPADAANAAALRRVAPALVPRPLGLRTSAGFGDRLGLATPGHVRALRRAGEGIAPIFAQQSIREMTRTCRSPQQVLDEAMWGVMAEGWRDPWGADADHLKSPADVDVCLAAGFTFFTIDPGEHVDDRAESLPAPALQQAWDALPWSDLADSPADLRRRFLGQRVAHDELARFDEETLARAAVKYGRAVAHVARLFRHLRAARSGSQVELEISVDETATPTRPADHVYVACELRRLGVEWVSLAPRFVGRFEKGVDYIGDLAAFEADVLVHAAIAREFGPYKLSLHSGSDKFSIYPAVARSTRGLVHLKTAGTSYLEALRTIATTATPLFREIYEFACERYDTDRATYHVSAEVSRAPRVAGLAPADLPGLLDDFDAREILHVTFGSVLTATTQEGGARFAPRLRQALEDHAEAYAANLESHFSRHLAPFVVP